MLCRRLLPRERDYTNCFEQSIYPIAQQRFAFSLHSTPTRSAASAAVLMAAAPEEHLDVLNAAGEKTGVSKPRHAPVLS